MITPNKANEIIICNVMLYFFNPKQYNRFAMQVREAVIPNQAEPVEHPVSMEKAGKGLNVSVFPHLNMCLSEGN